MGSIFGDGGAKKRAEEAEAIARKEKQTSNEEANRAQQRGERGAGNTRSGRNKLMGNIGAQLKKKIGE